MVAFMYLFLIRPQQQQAKRRQQMLGALKVGDHVVTVGGLHGRIHALTDDQAILEVAENVHLTFNRGAIGSVRSDS